MFIAIIGTRFSGKSSVEDYLVLAKGFTAVRIQDVSNEELGEAMKESTFEGHFSSSDNRVSRFNRFSDSVSSQVAKHRSFLSMSPLPESPAPTSFPTRNVLSFSSPSELLVFVTRNWQENFVTTDISRRDLVEPFIRRPFFMLLSIDAPLYQRFKRADESYRQSLEDFIREDDDLVFGSSHKTASKLASGLQNMRDLVDIQITNSFQKISDFHSHLDDLDLLDPNHLRPGWDAYFMTLASLASRRSNCMKRRVGAVLVRENRVLATGYNGTPRGLRNCNEGGCPPCNGSIAQSPYECICLHAEENALLEAGRERVGENSVIYCNTCPCLKCTIKIIQTGVKAVVYNLTYKVDDASALLFKQAGVQLRRYDPSNNFRMTLADDQ